MRMNQAQLKSKIHAYILNAILTNQEINDGYQVQTMTDSDRVRFVYECFKSEFWHEYEVRRHNGSEVIGFREWLTGLPSVINIDYNYSDILRIAKEWGTYKDVSGLTANQIDRYESKICDNWFNLLSVNFFQMLKKATKYPGYYHNRSILNLNH